MQAFQHQPRHEHSQAGMKISFLVCKLVMGEINDSRTFKVLDK